MSSAAPLLADAGAVNVLYGSADRLTATGNQFWNQNSTGAKGVAEEDDMFGFGLGYATGSASIPA